MLIGYSPTSYRPGVGGDLQQVEPGTRAPQLGKELEATPKPQYSVGFHGTPALKATAPLFGKQGLQDSVSL